MKCIAVDDEPLALDILKKYITQFAFLELMKVFDDAVEAAAYLKSNPVDLLFVDIDMPDLSGLELVAELNRKPIVIFTTAYKKFAHEGFELEATDYLLKPIAFERFEKAVKKAQERFRFQKSQREEIADSIIVKSEYRSVKILLNDIEYIEAMEDYIKIHLLSGRYPVLTLMSLKRIMENLPADAFSRIHRSYIVPNALVRSIQNRKVKLTTDTEVPVSDSYSEFIERWKKGIGI